MYRATKETTDASTEKRSEANEVSGTSAEANDKGNQTSGIDPEKRRNAVHAA
jgi:hypothetical protein